MQMIASSFTFKFIRKTVKNPLWLRA